LSIIISTACDGTAIAPKKDGMLGGRNLGVFNSILQRWNVRLFKSISSKSHSKAIISQKNCMETTCSHLGVYLSILQYWNVAFSVKISPESLNTAITSQKHGMIIPCRNHFGRIVCAKSQQELNP
jgi:hypothetical protein